MKTGRQHPGRHRAFTLIEMLVSMVIMSFIMIALVTALGQTQSLWNQTQDRAEKFREARIGFETVSRRLSNATLNPYWGYDDAENPTEYARQSGLHFVVGPSDVILEASRENCGSAVFFQAPFGYGGEEAGARGGGKDYEKLDDALNCWGYYVEYNSDMEIGRPLRPDFLESSPATSGERMRFRLMEYRLPTERLALFDDDFAAGAPLSEALSSSDINHWFSDSITRVENSSPVAENILTMILTPRAPGKVASQSIEETDIAPDYHFDSRRYQWDDGNSLSEITRHQIPPVIDMTLIALTEASWNRFDESGGDALGLLEFVNSLFTESKRFDEDLKILEEKLASLKLDHRIFSTTIALRSGKWITSPQK